MKPPINQNEVTKMHETVEELRAKLAENAAMEAELLIALEDAQGLVLDQTREEVARVIDASGFTRAEVLGLDDGPAQRAGKGKGKGKVAATQETGTVYRLHGDPTRTYVRGRMPKWLSEAMAAKGLDPAKPDDRRHFRECFMDAT